MIVAGFDGTDASRCAVRWAAARAGGQGCPLYVVRVLESVVIAGGGWAPVGLFSDAQQRVYAEEELLSEIEACRTDVPGLDVHGAIHDGGACLRLANHADVVNADMIVVGASDRGPFVRFVLGSMPGELVRAAGRPVVSVRDVTPVQQASSLLGLSSVVVGLDGLDDPVVSGRALGFACDVATQDRVPVTVVVGEDGADRVEWVLEPWRRRYPSVPLTTDIVRGRPEHALAACSEDAHLLVVGRCGRGASLVRTALRYARCTVAVVSR